MHIVKDSKKKCILVILGPTASGKSALAVKLAKKYQGEIISADSRQVYKGMNLGTGKITKKEIQGIPHYCLDVVSPRTRYDVTRWKKRADCAITRILSRDKLPIICGGTGLYIKALTENIDYPDVPPNLSLRAQLEKKSVTSLYTQLQKKDPLYAQKIDHKNKRRLIRALEIIHAIGRVPPLQKKPQYDVLFLGMRKSSSALKKAIIIRLQERIKKGMLQEVKNLHTHGLSWKRMTEIGLEYKYIALHLQNKMTEKEMRETLVIKIGQYARRQMTWFRKMKDIHWMSIQETESQLKKSV